MALLLRTALLLALFATLAACAGRDTAPPVDTDDPRTARNGVDDRSGVTRGADARDGFRDMEALEPHPDDPVLSNLVVYFEFDRDDVRSEFNDLLRAHAEFLAENPRRRVRLEGHTDERGSREYNVGLGERRALSVRRTLLLQGVSADQITTVSYGEERPAELGSNERAWAANRRVELVYRQ